MPPGNLSVVGVARVLALRNQRHPVSPADRTRLRETVRYDELRVVRAEGITSTNREGVESITYRLSFSNGLGAAATWLKSTAVTAAAPATIVLHDGGRERRLPWKSPNG